MTIVGYYGNLILFVARRERHTRCQAPVVDDTAYSRGQHVFAVLSSDDTVNIRGQHVVAVLSSDDTVNTREQQVLAVLSSDDTVNTRGQHVAAVRTSDALVWNSSEVLLNN